MNQLTIVKIGGKVIEDPTVLAAFLKDFAKITGYKILVHGGGRSATDLADQLGVATTMVQGRRITDKKTLDIAVMVYAGLVNKTIVAQLQALGLDAIGLTGADVNLICSTKRPVLDGVDYGLVGDVKKVNSQVLNEMLQQHWLPVLVPITHDGNGQLLNTNADTVAAETAKALAFDFNVRLIYCFEKNGVLSDETNDNSVIPRINKEEFQRLKSAGIITGGMIPKVENALQAIAAGVKEVIITSSENLNTGKGTLISEMSLPI
ncbi:acetylglutamate kinase [Candidatus Symbiothrix dinenymphae]|nr:acetylglutamate kinase [Candidatus Symbiothrix dinenymphae]